MLCTRWGSAQPWGIFCAEVCSARFGLTLRSVADYSYSRVYRPWAHLRTGAYTIIALL